MKESDVIALVAWFVLMPIFGIVGYVYDISWLLYVFGGFMLLTYIFFLITGALACLGTILLVLSWVIGYYVTSSFWIGLLLGSCITASVLSITLIAVLCFSGISTISRWLKGNKGDDY